MVCVKRISWLCLVFLWAVPACAADIPNVLVLSDEVAGEQAIVMMKQLQKLMVFTEKNKVDATFSADWKYVENGSSGILDYLKDSSVPMEKNVRVLMIGCGYHDIQKQGSEYVIDKRRYRENIQQIVKEALRLKVEVFWFNSAHSVDFLCNQKVDTLNAIAAAVMAAAAVQVADYNGFTKLTRKPSDNMDQRHISISKRREGEFLAEALAQWWTASAQTNLSVRHIDLWKEEPPFYEKVGEERINDVARLDYVSRPELLQFLPKKRKNATAVIFFPGGGYQFSGFLRNARELAEILDSVGIVVFGLKYRTKRNQEVPLEDAQRAVRYVRANAEMLGIDPRRIGVAGQSAGAHLVMNLCSHYSGGNAIAKDSIDRVGSRPDFAAVFSVWNFLSQELPFSFRPDVPPFFVRHAKDDNSFTLAQRLVENLYKKGVPVDVQFLENGGHGAFEISENNTGRNWPLEFIQWLGRL